MSDLGRVRSMDRIVADKRTGTAKLKGRIMQPGRRGSHLAVGLSKGGIKTTIRIHRLVAAAWIGPCPDGLEVCHGPNGQMDNSVGNLRYDTHSNNGLDKRRDGTHRGRCVRRSDSVEFINLHVAAEESGCHYTNIWLVCNNKRKTAGGYGWEYI